MFAQQGDIEFLIIQNICDIFEFLCNHKFCAPTEIWLWRGANRKYSTYCLSYIEFQTKHKFCALTTIGKWGPHQNLTLSGCKSKILCTNPLTIWNFFYQTFHHIPIIKKSCSNVLRPNQNMTLSGRKSQNTLTVQHTVFPILNSQHFPPYHNQTSGANPKYSTYCLIYIDSYVKTNFVPQPKYDTFKAQTNNIQHSTVFCVLIASKSINYAPQLLWPLLVRKSKIFRTYLALMYWFLCFQNILRPNRNLTLSGRKSKIFKIP